VIGVWTTLHVDYKVVSLMTKLIIVRIILMLT
jgi:hypothetical protein